VFFCYGSDGYGFGLLNDGTPFLTAVGSAMVQGGQKITDTAFHHLAVAKNGTNLVIYVDGAASLTVSFTSVFQFNSVAAIGARGDNLTSVFLGEIDEISIYSRALQASEIQAIYNTTVLGKCPIPISFLGPPTGQSVTVGGTTSLNANFTGTSPASFQWFLNGHAIVGATNSSLLLNGLTFFQAGNYSLTANNGFGPLTVSNFVVNVTERPLLVNGSFETGDFTGWVTSNLAFTTYPTAVRPVRFNPGFGFFFGRTDGWHERRGLLL